MTDKDIVMKHSNINTGEGSLEVTDRLSAAKQKTINRISLESIKQKIEHLDYMSPDRHPHMIICVITLNNGFVVLGKSAPADPLNFDQNLGRQFAYEDAVRQIWPLEAYILREKMSHGEATGL